MKQAIMWILILLPQAALAADGSMPDSLLPAGLKMIGALLLVLGVIMLFYYLSRKGFGFLPTARTGVIKVVEMRYLMPKKAICLIQVRNKELLLAIGPERIERIMTFDQGHNESFEETLRTSIEADQ